MQREFFESKSIKNAVERVNNYEYFTAKYDAKRAIFDDFF